MAGRIVDTAVVLVAGLGTRMAPFSSSVPKFMAGVVEGNIYRPAIDYTLNDCIGAGIKNIVFVTSNGGEEQLRKYLGPINSDVKDRYLSLGKMIDLEREQARRAVFSLMNIEYIDQPAGQYGTAVPLGLAKSVLKGVDCFAVIGGDDFVWHQDGKSELSLALDTWQQHGTGHAIMGKPVPRIEAPKYGILQVDNTGHLVSIDEKPPLERVPEEPLANISRYIINGDGIWPYLDDELAKSRDNLNQPEYLITDVINAAIANGQTFQTHAVQGIYLDAGTPQGILNASMYISNKLKAES